jgi:hypothetical protein
MRTFLTVLFALATQASLASGFNPGDTGACCIDDPPSCFENFSEFSCQALGGAWQGPGSTCADCAPDPSGACCFDGSDCFDATSTYCDAVDGTWLGPGTTCAQQGSQCVKDPTGACCIGTGCVNLAQGVCKGSGGYWLGPDTTCAANGDSCVNQPLHVPGQYDTIDDAVDDAVDGDEIIVAPGVHYGSGSSVFDTQGKSLYIHSSEGALVTFLDGEGQRRIVLCDSGEDAGTVIEGFSMINGASGAGGGIWVRNDSSPVFRECIISGCEATNGGGCSIEDSSPLFDRCNFVENETLAFGSAIDALEGSDFELRECVIQFNTTGDTSAATAAVNLRESSIALIGQTVICENTPLQIVGDWIDGGGNTICSDCIGDLTGDGQIDGGDLTVVLGYWGTCSSDCIGDLNGDGLVDGGDITIILAYWGSCL